MPEINTTSDKPLRIAKFLSMSGICSRRDGEKILSSGRIEINGIKIFTPAINIKPFDIVKFDGKIITWHKYEAKLHKPRIWLFHKPRNTLVSHFDPQGRTTIFDYVRKHYNISRTISVGRLDYATEGLIILTDAGYIARFFELPINAVKRIYHCNYISYTDISKKISKHDISKASEGLIIDGIRYNNIKISRCNINNSTAYLKNAKNHQCIITLNEGKNREIRKIMAFFGFDVMRLVRLKYHDFSIESVPNPGDLYEVPWKDLRISIQEINLKEF